MRRENSNRRESSGRRTGKSKPDFKRDSSESNSGRKFEKRQSSGEERNYRGSVSSNSREERNPSNENTGRIEKRNSSNEYSRTPFKRDDSRSVKPSFRDSARVSYKKEGDRSDSDKSTYRDSRTRDNKSEGTRRSFDKPISRDRDDYRKGNSSNSSEKSSFRKSEGKDNRGERSSKSYEKPYSKGKSYGEKKTYGDKENTERSERSHGYSDFKKSGFRKKSSGSSKPSLEQQDGTIRLNKYISNAGICSRREADTFIQAGLVTVNGKLITELGTRVTLDDDVRYNGDRISPEKKVYILLNKPKDCVTTMDDPYAQSTVMDLIKGACKERVYPVGRLDRNTTGVLLLTNDGELAKKLTHPKYEQKKIYHVFLDKNVKTSDFDKLIEGVELEDGIIVKADEVSYVDPEDKSQVGIEIHSGINRVIRRMFETLGYKVSKLDRVYFAGLTKKNVKRGEWRLLDQTEVNMLSRMVGNRT